MAIPSGSGTEVLKVALTAGVTNAESVVLGGVANHIYTILSIVWCEQGAAAETISLYSNYDGGVTPIKFLEAQALPANGTFTWYDKIVLTGTDTLVTLTGSAANVDWWCSYIDQDWT